MVAEHSSLVWRRDQAAGVEQSFRFVEVRDGFQLFGDGQQATETFFPHGTFTNNPRGDKAGTDDDGLQGCDATGSPLDFQNA